MFAKLSSVWGNPDFQLNGAMVAGAAVVGFLALFWVLKGLPPGRAAVGEMDDEAPSSGHRDRVVAAVAVGFLLIILGAYLAIARGALWSVPVFAMGFGLVLSLVAVNRRHRHSSPSLRRAVEFSSAILNIALVAGVLIVANVIAFRYGGHEIDLTRERTHSLAPLSLNQLASLDRPVTFHLVYGRGARAFRQLDRIGQLLDLYRGVRPDLIRIESVDPFTDLSRLEDLTRRAPDLGAMRGGGVLIEYGEGDDARFVGVGGPEMFDQPLVERDGENLGRFETTFRGEDAITSALIRIREGRAAKAAFTTGHGEGRLDDLEPNGPGLGIWRNRLTANGWEVVETNLLREAVPDDADLLVIAGPKEPFKPQEVARLKEHADQGKPVLALLDNTEPAGLDEFLGSFNLAIRPGLVIDPQINFNRNVQLVFCMLGEGVSHPIIDALGSGRAVLIPNGAPIEILGLSTNPKAAEPAQPINRNLVPFPILKSGPRSWAETNLKASRPRFEEGADWPGPVIVAAAVTERPAESAPNVGSEALKPRLVLISSRSVAENLVQEIEPTNLDLVMSAVSWLRGRPDAIGIAPKTHAALTLTADPQLRRRLVVAPTVVSMLTIIGFGALVHYIRRD